VHPVVGGFGVRLWSAAVSKTSRCAIDRPNLLRLVLRTQPRSHRQLILDGLIRAI